MEIHLQAVLPQEKWFFNYIKNVHIFFICKLDQKETTENGVVKGNVIQMLQTQSGQTCWECTTHVTKIDNFNARY